MAKIEFSSFELRWLNWHRNLWKWSYKNVHDLTQFLNRDESFKLLWAKKYCLSVVRLQHQGFQIRMDDRIRRNGSANFKFQHQKRPRDYTQFDDSIVTENIVDNVEKFDILPAVRIIIMEMILNVTEVIHVGLFEFWFEIWLPCTSKPTRELHFTSVILHRIHSVIFIREWNSYVLGYDPLNQMKSDRSSNYRIG